MTNWEIFLLNWTGKIVALIAFGGICLTVVFDKLARGIWQSWGYMQCSALAIFTLIFILGWLVDIMLNDARKIIEDYLRS